MKNIKLAVSAAMVILAVAAYRGYIPLDKTIPIIITAVAFITYMDAKRLARDGKENEARALMNTVIFMIGLIILSFFTDIFK